MDPSLICGQCSAHHRKILSLSTIGSQKLDKLFGFAKKPFSSVIDMLSQLYQFEKDFILYLYKRTG